MKDVQRSALDKAIVWLKAAGCTFAIIDADGNKHGDLEVLDKKKRRASAYPNGELSGYVGSYLSKLDAGGIAEVPLGKYDRRTVMSACSSWMCRHVGNGTHTSAFNKKQGIVEVLRIA